MQEENYSLDQRELGAEMNWNLDNEGYEIIKDGTAVQTFIGQPTYNKDKFQGNSPEHQITSERNSEGYRNPICDATTVSSKKKASASPPNPRFHVEEIPEYPISGKRKAKSSSSKSSTTCVIAEVSKKEKAAKWGAKRKKRNYESVAKAKASKSHFKTGRWTRLEHFKFLEALKLFGKEWQAVQKHVYTRTSTQARSHAQKFFVKLDKKQLTLDEFLEGLDIDKLRVDLKINDSGDSTEYDEEQQINSIIKLKNSSSVMNIALPGETYRMPEIENGDNLPVEQPVAFSREMQNCMNPEEEESRIIHVGNKRSSMQRRAKTNHAFFSKNYSESMGKNWFKRRKTDVDEEVIIPSSSETKIWINNFALKNIEGIEEEYQHEDELEQFEKEMEANSELDEILEGPGEMMREANEVNFDYFTPSGMDGYQESIDDIINSKPKDDGFKGFALIPNLDSNVQFMSNNQDWKVDSINFAEAKPMKLNDRLKDSVQEDVGLLNHALPSNSLIDNF